MLAMETERGDGVWGCDFCHPMLVIAREKAARRNLLSVVIESDALRLPFPDASFDLVTTAFGFRNLTNYRAGLSEMARVLRPGARGYPRIPQPPRRSSRLSVVSATPDNASYRA
jgi:demethylmenaquinone methyltransferase/2-methoxy-6-polyprenyl-1,4-benzoquinol methylase